MAIHAKPSSQGFTLVELLVVISIIALLLSILMPALNQVREQAKMVVCSSNFKTLGLGNAMYINEYKKLWQSTSFGVNPYPGTKSYIIYSYDGKHTNLPGYDPTPIANRVGGWYNHGVMFAAKYIPTAKVYFCPSEKRTNRTYKDFFKGDKMVSAYRLGTVRCSYNSRQFRLASGTDVAINPVNPLRDGEMTGKLAILADQWMNTGMGDTNPDPSDNLYTNAGGSHLRKYYITLYGDGHSANVADTAKIVTSLGLGSTANIRAPGVPNYSTALAMATQKYGKICSKLQWASGWLYLDSGSSK